MLQKLAICLIIFFSAILQTAVFSNSFFWGLGPDVMLLLVIVWTAREGFEKALFGNILAGFVQDLITFHPVGVHIVTYVLIAFFVSFISKRFLVVARNWRVFILIMMIIFGTLANNLFLSGLFLIENYFSRIAIGDVPVYFFSGTLLKAIILNSLFFPLVYFSMKKIESWEFLKTRSKIF
ncbi:MAG: rod shape-determining protein MreD [Parcubacteria group bacterium]|jgi:rod shape-determining protein MreD